MSIPVQHLTIEGEEHKRCSHCHEWKPVCDFSKVKSRWDGLCHHCKTCKYEFEKKHRNSNYDEYINKRRQYYKDQVKDSPHQLEYVTKYQLDNKEIIQMRNMRYKELNRDKIRESSKIYRMNNHDKEVLRTRLYRQSDRGKEIGRLHVIKRRSKLGKVRFTIRIPEWYSILEKQNYLCAGCGTEFTRTTIPEMDHIFPLSLGGDTEYRNIQALCRKCNSSKGNKIDWTYPLVKEWT